MTNPALACHGSRIAEPLAPLRNLLAAALAVALMPASAIGAESGSGQSPDCRGVEATIVGSPGDDEITGTPGRDVIVTGPGNDRIHAGAGNDLVCAGADDDVVEGMQGDDRILGGAGRDLARGGPGADLLAGGGGPDELAGGPEDDALLGGRGADGLNGGSGGDRCVGGPPRLALVDLADRRGCERVRAATRVRIDFPREPTPGAVTIERRRRMAGTLQVRPGAVRAGATARVAIANRGRVSLLYGLGSRVERRVAGGWQDVTDRVGPHAVPGIGLIVWPGQINAPRQAGFTDRLELPVDLEPGIYRVLKNVSPARRPDARALDVGDVFEVLPPG